MPTFTDGSVTASKKIIRKSWPRIRAIIVKGQNFYQVDARRKGTNGKRETFSSRSEAEERANDICADFNAGGIEGLALPAELRVAAINAEKMLKPFKKTLIEAAVFYKAHLEAEVAKANSRLVNMLVEDWVTEKNKTSSRPLRTKTLADIRETANILKKNFGQHRILEVTTKNVESFINDMETGQRRKYNIRNRLGQFFNWCVKRGHSTTNPAANIEIHVSSSDVVILDVLECARLMEVCEAEFHDLTLYTAICLFAGLRPTECALLTWDSIHLEERQINVLRGTSKVKETRNVPIENNLLEWLSRHEGERHGLVTRKANLETRLKKLRARMGYRIKLPKQTNFENPDGKKWVADVLRHSYASYWLAKYKDRPHLAENMGTSVKMIKEHYKSVVSNTAFESFWSIEPKEAKIQKSYLPSQDEIRAKRIKSIKKSLEGS